MSKTAIVLGGTGLTGSHLITKLLEDDNYSKVKVFGRSSIGIEHPKLEEKIMDLLNMEEHKAKFNGDVLFCCIGTTKKKTPNQEHYHKIDFGIPVNAAKYSKENGINSFAVMSSMGANHKSSIFYSRTKGEMENAVLGMGIPHTYILRPALITGNRNEKRGGEKFFAGIMRFFDLFMFGGLKKYRSIKSERIAECMIRLAASNTHQRIIDSGQIQQIADNVK
ncbi:MAG: NAD(P)H-binding protein [Crocinitomicaceae bacterium]|nr:NAD(P)H-binding protein [Crocinitomicaceae bacterium]